MILRRPASILLSCLALPIVLSLAGCTSLKMITINPVAGVTTLTAIGQTAQFTAIGTSQQGSASPTTNPISVDWSVTNPGVATISSTGLATAVGAGYTQIMAESGGVTATTDLTVTLATNGGGTGSGGGASVVTSLAIIPGSQAIASPSQTTQFLAIGTTSTGATLNLTNQVVWSTSSTQIATIGASSGLATGVSQGSATVTALYTNTAAGTVVPGSATFTIASGAPEKYTSVTLTPAAELLSASGQTGQFIALAASGSTGLLTNVTSSPQIAWTSSIPSIATVSPAGVVTGDSPGTVTITAVVTNTDGTVVSNTASVTTTVTAAPEPLLSLTIIPNSVSVGNLQDTAQFLAIGTYSTPPYVRDLTNTPDLTWISSFPSVFPVDTNNGGNSGASAGIVTAYGSGSATIIAEATNPLDGTIQTATATFNCPLALANPAGNPPEPGSCVPGTQAFALLSTLTIYNEGLNNTNWEVTAPSATNTPNVIHCGPGWALGGGTGGSVCVATYPIGATVVLKASGGAFGGWSYNCTPSDLAGNPLVPATISATGPNYCAVTFSPAVYDALGNVITPANSNVTLGAIFN
jgi:hypothetical protein